MNKCDSNDTMFLIAFEIRTVYLKLCIYHCYIQHLEFSLHIAISLHVYAWSFAFAQSFNCSLFPFQIDRNDCIEAFYVSVQNWKSANSIFTEADISFAHKRWYFFTIDTFSIWNIIAIGINRLWTFSHRIEIISHKMKTRAIELWDIINSIELCNWISSWNQSVRSARYGTLSVWTLLWWINMINSFIIHLALFILYATRKIGWNRKIC